MPNREQIQGRWNEVKGRLQEHWGQLTDDDLRQFQGSAEQLVGMVQRKTGAARSEVERFLDDLFHGSMRDQAAQTLHQYTDAAQGFADDAGRYARQQARRLAEQSSDYSAQLTSTVRNRPAESLAIAFGLGIAAGAFFFLGRKR